MKRGLLHRIKRGHWPEWSFTPLGVYMALGMSGSERAWCSVCNPEGSWMMQKVAAFSRQDETEAADK